MPDVRNRKDKERQLAAAVEKELSRFGRFLARTIPGLQSAMEIINPDYWSEHSANMTSAVSPKLQDIYSDQAAVMLEELPFLGIDWAIFNADASRWARQYTFELVTGLNLTSERAVREAIISYFEQGWTQQQLTNALAPTFGPVRAEMIAVTETTRAAVEGESDVVRRLEEDSGIIMRPFWLTANDEIADACPICGPRNEKEIRPDNETRGEYPPAHPRCRCLVRHEIIP